MAILRVFHCVDFKVNGDWQVGVGDTMKFPLGYKLVAQVDTGNRKVFKGGDETLANLQFAYHETNHIEASWMENSTVMAEAGPHRSTSVGDVVVDQNNHVWIVDGCGFSDIGTIVGEFFMGSTDRKLYCLDYEDASGRRTRKWHEEGTREWFIKYYNDEVAKNGAKFIVHSSWDEPMFGFIGVGLSMPMGVARC